jgi:hypothetical protein
MRRAILGFAVRSCNNTVGGLESAPKSAQSTFGSKIPLTLLDSQRIVVVGIGITAETSEAHDPKDTHTMNTFKLTTPNGIVIESTWDDIATTAVVTAPKVLELPKAAPVAKAPKVPTTKAPKAAKPAKSPKGNNVGLLEQIRALKVAGKYSEAVKLTPPSWLQVIGEIQLHAERHNGQGAEFNAAPKVAKAAKKARKASKKPVVAKAETAPVGALDMPADTGSAKPTVLAPKVEAAVHATASLRDQLKDIGVDGFANELLCGDVSLKATRAMYLSATEDEVLDLMAACKQEALLIEDAAERCEAAKLSCVDVANGLVELWKFFAAKLMAQAELMTAAV